MVNPEDARRQKNCSMEEDKELGLSKLSLETTENEPVEEQNQTRNLNDSLDLLYEKKKSSQELGLARLAKAFTSRVELEFLTHNCETICDKCLSIMNKGSTSQVSLASCILGLIALSIGESKLVDMVYNASRAQLCQLISHNNAEEIRVSAMKSLALLVFTGGSDKDTSDVLSFLWEVGTGCEVSENSAKVRASAFSCWAFLLTTVTKEWFSSNSLEKIFMTWGRFLRRDDPLVCIAIGEGIAVVFEKLNVHIVQENFVSEHCYDDVITQIPNLASEAGSRSTSHTSKENLKSQRSFFKELLEYIQEGHAPSMLLNCSKTGKFKFSAWEEIVQVNMFRDCLGGGFQSHMLGNQFIHTVLNITPTSSKEKLTPLEKRLYRSPNSVSNKNRTKEMNRSRSKAHAAKYQHYSEGFDM